ncbi:MAG TPA: glycosyltransferase family 39 protein [Candidatus Acidoferrales bacterium]|nr:glycosyltransferase family 39 protein [Candidatus Acidoferrales bacterium]
MFLAVVVLVSAISYFSQLGALGLVGPDEPRYVSIARAMERTGHWVTPRLNGVPWFEKPALYYWSAAVSMKVFGENDYAARLPSALAALLVALVIGWAARRFYDRTTSAFAMLMWPSSVAAIVFARGATTDMLFAGTLAATMILSATIIFDDTPDPWIRFGFGFFLGAATLAKGPAAVVLAGGSAALWMIVTRRWLRTFRLLDPLAIGAFILTAVPWYAICAARNPGFLTTFFVLHNFERFVTPVFHHVQPVWFFIPILVLTVLPWSALMFAVGRDAWLAKKTLHWASRPGIYFGCWVIFVVLFFSASKSKLPDYILPAVPPLILLLAEAAARMRCRRDDADRGIAMGLGVTWLAVGVIATFWLHRQSAVAGLGPNDISRYWFLGAAAAGGIAIAALGSARRIAAAFLLNAALIAGLVLAANWILLPKLDPVLSPRTAARAFQSAAAAANGAPSGIPADTVQIYRLQAAWEYGLEYYMGRSLQEWAPSPEGVSLVFTTEAGCRDMTTRGIQCVPLQTTAPSAWLVRAGGHVGGGNF